MNTVFICFFFLCLIINTSSFTSEPPSLAPIEKKDWDLCEQFIQNEAPALFAKGITFIPKKPSHPYPIEKDPATGHIYIHLKQNPESFIGRGSHKVVTKSILYGKKSKIVAHCEIDQPGTREAKILALMKNAPGIIQCYSYIKRSENTCSLFLQYCNRGTLSRLIKLEKGSNYLNRRLHLTDTELLPIMDDIASATKNMHDRGFIHRDIKRGNILLHKTGQITHAVLADLGLALEIDQHLDHVLCVPNETCPPEILITNYPEIDRKKAETYSIGVLFYLMVFNHNPSFADIAKQNKLENWSFSTKQKKYNQIKSLYEREVKESPIKVQGMRRKALLIALQMMHPDPKTRISLPKAIEKIRALADEHS